MKVHQYLASSGMKPWRWGGGLSGFCGQDCTLFAADWALRLNGRDPGDGIRGTYDDEAGALAVLRGWGGVEEFVETRLSINGWDRASEPRDGDIGVVKAPLAPLGVFGDVPAIYAGELWVIRTLHGQRGGQFQHNMVFRA